MAVSTPPPPVQPPPHRFEKQPPPASGASVFGLFWDAVAKVQNGESFWDFERGFGGFWFLSCGLLRVLFCGFLAAHSSLDEYLADWFGLNQSKYQWALDDYYRGKSVVSLISVLI